MIGSNHAKEGIFRFELFQAPVLCTKSKNTEMEENKK